jgi:hypothetical protein
VSIVEVLKPAGLSTITPALHARHRRCSCQPCRQVSDDAMNVGAGGRNRFTGDHDDTSAERTSEDEQ